MTVAPTQSFQLAADPAGQTVGDHLRQLGATLSGHSLAEAARQRRPLFGGDFGSPLLAARDSALEHNMRQMDDYCAQRGVTLIPHGKTAMAPQLVERQLRRGAWGVAAASVSQARVFHRHGIPRILIANQIVDAAGIAWLARHIADPERRLICYVDSLAGVRLLADGLRHAAGRLDVLVEVATPGGRAGCRDVAQAVEVAAAAAAEDRLRLVGVTGFEGILVRDRTPDSVGTVRAMLRHVRAAAVAIAEARHFAGLPEILVTAGGSIFFPEAVEELAGGWNLEAPVRFALRCSCYATHDSGLYTELSPFGTPVLPGTAPQRPALELWAQVLSRPEPELAILNFGKRDAPFSEGFPSPFRIRAAGLGGAGTETAAGGELDAAGTEIVDLNDQHAYLRLPASHGLAVGDWIGMGISHPCLALDRWSVLPIVDDADTVVDLYRMFF
ncbi:MAG: alanine racemase [Micromonosporaceae bacterium]